MSRKRRKGKKNRPSDAPVSASTWSALNRELHGESGERGRKGASSAPLEPLSSSQPKSSSKPDSQSSPSRDVSPRRGLANNTPPATLERRDQPEEKPSERQANSRPSTMRKAEEAARVSSARKPSPKARHRHEARVAAAKNPAVPRPSGAPAPPRVDVDLL